MKTEKAKRINCNICSAKRLLKNITIIKDINLCNDCVSKSQELSSLIKMNKEIGDTNNLSNEEVDIHNNTFYQKVINTVNSEKNSKLMKSEIINKVKSQYNVDEEASKRVNKVINSMSNESLEEIVETIRETDSVETFKEKTEIKKLKQSLTVPDPKSLYDRINTRVIDQDQAVKALSIAITKHFSRIEDSSIRKNNIMIMGPTGTGKTELVKSLAKEVDLPVVVVDATNLTASGYKGLSPIDTIISAIVSATKGKPEGSGKCIVFIDEIDKKATIHNDEHGIGTEIVQQELLTLLQGGIVRAEKSGELDSSNIMVIAAGAFAGIEDIVGKRKKQNRIGLNSNSSNADEIPTNSFYGEVSTKDLIEYGFIPEFIGRFSTLTYTNPLTKKSLLKVLSEKKDSIVNDYEKIFKSLKIEVKFSKEFLEEIVEETIELGLGARGLNRVMDSKMEEVLFNVYDYVGKKIQIGKDSKVSVIK